MQNIKGYFVIKNSRKNIIPGLDFECEEFHLLGHRSRLGSLLRLRYSKFDLYYSNGKRNPHYIWESCAYVQNVIEKLYDAYSKQKYDHLNIKKIEI